MKKLAVAAALAAMVMTASGVSQNAPDGIQRIMDHVRNYATNDARRAEREVIAIPSSMTNSADLALIDSILEAKPPRCFLYTNVRKYRIICPRTFAAAKVRYADRYPHLVAMANILAENGSIKDMPKKDIAAAFIEGVNAKAPEQVQAYRRRIGSRLSPLIVPALRRQGKAVTVGPDGTNPVKQYADRVSAAINAPRFEGLNAILEELDVPARMDIGLLELPTDEEIRKIIDDAMSGERELRTRMKAKLSVALGVDGYNAFVERYNGGTR